MNRKLKKIFTNTRVIILLVFLILAVVAMHPNPYKKGVAIRNVISHSSANMAGIPRPKPNMAPMRRESIITINNRVINNMFGGWVPGNKISNNFSGGRA